MNYEQDTFKCLVMRRIMACGLVASLFLMSLMFSACERIQQVVAPGEHPMVSPDDGGEGNQNRHDLDISPARHHCARCAIGRQPVKCSRRHQGDAYRTHP